jgi:hypothetical protein
MAITRVDLEEIRGLKDLWARSTMLEAPRDSRPVPARSLLDVLGLGLEQTMALLGRDRPDWRAFADWITTTAGPFDAEQVARYQAWYDGATTPASELARQQAVMAVPPVFSADDLAEWERDGVVVLRGAVSRAQAAAIAEHLWAIIGADPADPATWYGRRPNGIMIQHFQHPTMDVPRRSQRIAKGFAELYGHADLIVSTDRLSFNPPERPRYIFPGPHLHWDGNLTPPIAFETQAILYLTDTAADQGALQVVPGFHHRLADGWIASLNGADPRTVDLSSEAVTVPAGAGDLVIWRHEIPHGASANRSDRPRLAQYVNHYPMHWSDQRPWL